MTNASEPNMQATLHTVSSAPSIHVPAACQEPIRNKKRKDY